MENKSDKRIISVSDINSYLYCARKLYLSKVCGLRVSMNRNMAVGRLKHSILEAFSKNEEKFVSDIDKDYDRLELVFMYEDFIKNLAARIFAENSEMCEKFMVDKDDMTRKIIRDFSEDIRLRIASIKSSLSKGFRKDEIWSNLDSLYISELRLESEALGLRGRADRVMISKSEGTIIPFELKSREDNIFHSDEIQLTAYAMLLEEKYKRKILIGMIEVGNNKKEIPITEANKSEIIRISDIIRNFENSPPPAMQSNFNKCRHCEFQEECSKI